MRDRDGCTPLYCAAAWNRLEAVQLLEQLGCAADERSEEGRTAVHVAAEQGWVELLDYLISKPGDAGKAVWVWVGGCRCGWVVGVVLMGVLS